VVGGRGQLLGPIIGIWVVFILPNVGLVQYVDYRLLIYGTLTLLTVMLFPDGIVGSIERWRKSRSIRSRGEKAFRIDPFLERLKGRADQAPSETDYVVEVRNGVKRFGAVVAVGGVDMKVR